MTEKSSCGPNCQCVNHDRVMQVKSLIHADKQINDLANLFKILNDATRIKILEAIKLRELCVCDLGVLIGVSKSAISHQMKYLKQYNLVKGRKEGKMVYYSLARTDVSDMIHHAHRLLVNNL